MCLRIKNCAYGTYTDSQVQLNLPRRAGRLLLFGLCGHDRHVSLWANLFWRLRRRLRIRSVRLWTRAVLLVLSLLRVSSRERTVVPRCLLLAIRSMMAGSVILGDC